MTTMDAKNRREQYLNDAFNITTTEHDRIYAHQNRVCFICERPITKPRRPHTDHRHKDGLVRGILCSQCNRALGKIEDPRWQWTYKQVYRAALYMLTPPAVEAIGERFGFPGKIGTKRYRDWLRKKKKSEGIQATSRT